MPFCRIITRGPSMPRMMGRDAPAPKADADTPSSPERVSPRELPSLLRSSSPVITLAGASTCTSSCDAKGVAVTTMGCRGACAGAAGGVEASAAESVVVAEVVWAVADRDQAARAVRTAEAMSWRWKAIVNSLFYARRCLSCSGGDRRRGYTGRQHAPVRRRPVRDEGALHAEARGTTGNQSDGTCEGKEFSAAGRGRRNGS